LKKDEYICIYRLYLVEKLEGVLYFAIRLKRVRNFRKDKNDYFNFSFN